MNKPNIANLLKSTRTVLVKHSPEILTGMGIAGMVMTTVLAIKATPKALKLIEDKKKEEHTDKLTPVETVKAAWKPYIPVAITGVTSIACIVGASSVNTRRNAALATAYTLSETALKEYKDKVIETIGEKHEKEIREKINKDHIDQKPVTKSNVIFTDKGNTLCFDYHSGRYFRSDIDHIKRAVNELNRRLVGNGYVSLNDFYDELDLEHTKMGYDLGWEIDDGNVEIDFSAQIANDDTPCIVINYEVAPHHNFDKFAF
jgi:hypothetical protein